MRRFRVVTYNVHRCIGLDGKTLPKRIADVLQEVNADVVALQEVVSIPHLRPQADQPAYLAGQCRYSYCMGINRRHEGGAFGNLLLTRFPFANHCNHDISVEGREPRGCLRADLELEGCGALHVFNIHLGTSYFERRQQARKLLAAELLQDPSLERPRLILGDFNEWLPGLVSRLLSGEMSSVPLREYLRWPRTYPGVLPILHLDHIYHDAEIEVDRLFVHRSRLSLVASDHLPLVADLRLRCQ